MSLNLVQPHTLFDLSDIEQILCQRVEAPEIQPQCDLLHSRSIGVLYVRVGYKLPLIQVTYPKADLMMLVMTETDHLALCLFNRKVLEQPEQTDPLAAVVIEKLPKYTYRLLNELKFIAYNAFLDNHQAENVFVQSSLKLLRTRTLLNAVLDTTPLVRQNLIQNFLFDHASTAQGIPHA